MTPEAVLSVLRAREDDLRRRGVSRVALFGSVARGEGTHGSDLDLMVEIDPGATVDLFDYVGIIHFIEDLFPVRVDVADRAMLLEPVRTTAERDAVYAF